MIGGSPALWPRMGARAALRTSIAGGSYSSQGSGRFSCLFWFPGVAVKDRLAGRFERRGNKSILFRWWFRRHFQKPTARHIRTRLHCRAPACSKRILHPWVVPSGVLKAPKL